MTLWRPKVGTCPRGIRDSGFGGGEKGGQGRAYSEHRRGFRSRQGGGGERGWGGECGVSADAVAQGWTAAEGGVSERCDDVG